jgi:ankyrin repeat protein
MMINSDNTRFEIKPESSHYRRVTIPVLMVAADAADTLLVQSGAQVCLKGDTAHVAGTTCHENIVGGGLLAVSRIGDDFGLMRTFLNMRADVNYRDANGKTPLIMASERGHLGTIEKLLENGADVNGKDANGKTPLIMASERGRLDFVKKLLEKGADVNCKDANGKTAIDLAASLNQESLRDRIQNTLRENRDINIVGDQYGVIFEAAKQTMEKVPQSNRMVGDLKDLHAGQFKDAANGLRQFLKVPQNWAPAEQEDCAELEEEVRRLTDCPQCAKVQADVLKEMVTSEGNALVISDVELEEMATSEGNALLLKTSEITARLADDLVALQSARRTGKDKEEEKRLENKVQQTRKEINEIGGWYYGSENAPAVAWPEPTVKHDWGAYGQPMCDGCKKYGLDHSTISADFNYCLHEVSSEKECFNGVRDPSSMGRDGKTIDYFVDLPEAKKTGMKKPHVVSLRFYSSHSFGAVTNPLRDPNRNTQHPLASITYCIDEAIRKQLTWGAEDKDAASEEVVLWRGFSDLKISDEFKKFGGTEFAPMSTTTDVRVAVGYAIRKTTTGGALLMRIVTKNNLERGMDLQWISMFPGESERLLAPLTFMNKPKRFQEIEINGVNDQKVKLTVVEIEITAPPM